MNWGRFEKKFVITCPAHKHRHESLFRELHRVGLDDIEEICKAPSVYDFGRFVGFSAVPHVGSIDRRPIWAEVTLNHYAAVKIAYEVGAGSVLILENDVRFLKDLDRLQHCIDTIPDDYYLALFNAWYKPQWVGHVPLENNSGSPWAYMGRALSAGCYTMSRKGMEHFILMVESPVTCRGGFFRPTDCYWRRRYWPAGAGLYAAVPNAAVQQPFPGCLTGGGTLQYYDWVKINPEDYNDFIVPVKSPD